MRGRAFLGAGLLLAVLFGAVPVRAEEGTPNDAEQPGEASRNEGGKLDKSVDEVRKSRKAAWVDGALRAAKERRSRLLKQLREESNLQRRWESGDGGKDRGVRGRISDLQAERDELGRRAAALQKELAVLEEKVEDRKCDLSAQNTFLTAAEKSIRRQAQELKTRLDGTLLGMEQPDLARRAEALAKAQPTEDPDVLLERTSTLVALYVDVVKALSRAGTFEMEIAEEGAGGRVARRKILRIGDMTGFFAGPEGGGFVLRKSTVTDAGQAPFVGEARGLSGAQRQAVNRFVENPGLPALVPFDVTDGRGIAVARSSRTFAEWFSAGGVFMFPLAGLVILLVLIILWRGSALLWRAARMDRNCRKVLGLAEAGRMEDGRRLAAEIAGPEGKVLGVAFDHAGGKDRAVLEDAFNEALISVQPAFRRGLSLVALGAAIAPMLGLLGTVTGMITTFKSLVIFGASDPANLAGGISEALITTQAGLLVAVPTLLLRGVLGAVSESTLSKLEGRGMALVLLVRGRGDDASPPPDEKSDAAAEPGKPEEKEEPVEKPAETVKP
jgi:biopolymer transport protein ExbB